MSRPKPPAPSESAPLASVGDWKERFQSNLQRFPSSVRTMMSTRRSGFTIDDVYEDGTIVGSYTEGQDTFKLFAWNQDPPSGCSCERSNGKYACFHCFGFTTFIVEQLSKDSELVRRIQARDFCTRPLDLSEVKYGPTLHKLNQLSRFIDMRPDFGHADLPPPPTTQKRERLAWQVYMYSGNSLRLTPIVQPQNKRGDAWNKGRPVTMSQISKTVERLPGDQQLIDLCQDDYGSSISYKLITALTCLVGQNNVQFQNEPVEVVPGSTCMTLIEVTNGWIVRPEYGDQRSRLGQDH